MQNIFASMIKRQNDIIVISSICQKLLKTSLEL